MIFLAIATLGLAADGHLVLQKLLQSIVDRSPCHSRPRTRLAVCSSHSRRTR